MHAARATRNAQDLTAQEQHSQRLPGPPTCAKLCWKKNCSAALRHETRGVTRPCMAAAVAPISTPATQVLSSLSSAMSDLRIGSGKSVRLGSRACFTAPHKMPQALVSQHCSSHHGWHGLPTSAPTPRRLTRAVPAPLPGAACQRWTVSWSGAVPVATARNQWRWPPLAHC